MQIAVQSSPETPAPGRKVLWRVRGVSKVHVPPGKGMDTNLHRQQLLDLLLHVRGRGLWTPGERDACFQERRDVLRRDDVSNVAGRPHGDKGEELPSRFE